MGEELGETVKKKARFIAIMSLLVLLASRHAMGAAETGDAQVSQLLSDANNQAALVNNDLGTLNFIASSPLDWKNHVPIVSAYRQHIGALRSQAARLEAARKNASAWQAVSIDRIVPLLREFAEAADATLVALDKNPGGLGGADYKQYLKLNADLAGEFSSLIGTWVNYGKTREELGRVAQKIAAPVASPGAGR